MTGHLRTRTLGLLACAAGVIALTLPTLFSPAAAAGTVQPAVVRAIATAPAPIVGALDALCLEMPSDLPQPCTIGVNLSQRLAMTLTVNFATINQTAVAPADYRAVTAGVVTIPAGALHGTAVVYLSGHGVVGSPDKTFLVRLFNPQPPMTVGPPAVVTIHVQSAGQ